MFGQAGLGSITGTVVDPSGAVVPSASVRLTDIATKGVRAISTNDSGLFTLPSITPGQYSIAIAAAGFFAPYRSGTSLDGDMNHTYD